MTKEEKAVVRAALRWGKESNLAGLSPAEAGRLMLFPASKRLARPVAALMRAQSKRKKGRK